MSFIGREREGAAVRSLLEAHRLVTLTGVGGVGKTRLALRVADQTAGQFADGVTFAPLAPIKDSALVLPTIAQKFGVREASGASLLERLQRRLAGKRCLLVLDSFEHVLSAAPVVPALLRACPHLKVLVTSRAVLRVSGEHIYAVPPMRLPEPTAAADRLNDYEAVQLFIERAQAAGPEFTLTDANAVAVAEICRRLDGLPLAIELAAGVRALNPQAILMRLDHRFDLLVNGSRDAPDRHQTLRGAISWSYDLLAPREQTVFRRLGAFVGGWTLPAAEAVCALDARSDTLHALTVLLEHGLVQITEQLNGDSRFGVLETIREYALDRMTVRSEDTDAQWRHAAYFLTLAEDLGHAERLWDANASACLRRLEEEQDNLRAALRWLIDRGSHVEAVRLAIALQLLWMLGVRYSEGRRWLGELLDHPDAQARNSDRGRLLSAAAALANRQGDLSVAQALAEEAVAIARECNDRLLLVRAVADLAGIRASQGDLVAARALSEEALALGRSLGLTGRTLTMLVLQSECAWMEGDHATAHRLATEALAMARGVGAHYTAAYALLDLGRAALGLGDLKGARKHLEEGLTSAKRHGGWTIGFFFECLGRVALRDGKFARARELFSESLTTSHQIDDRRCMIPALEGLAALAVQQNGPERAFRLAGAADCLREAIGAQGYRQGQRDELVRLLERARQVLGSDHADLAWKCGRALSLDEAIAAALSTAGSRLKGTGANGRRSDRLTKREVEVLSLLAEGRSNLEAASSLVISVRTVERHIASVYRKIGARGRADAVLYAVRHGLS